MSLHKTANPTPRVSVLMMVMNGVPLIEECMASVLGQTLKDFEFLIIDDGSSDQTWKKINSFNDRRIRAFKQENMGVAASANRGLMLARAPYIARIDHDDLMLPTRLEKQLRFLDLNPDIALVGTHAQLIYEDRLSTDYFRPPVSSVALSLRLLFENPIVHPSIMMRTEIARAIGGYCIEEWVRSGEDFELWTRLSSKHRISTLPEGLIQYRIRLNSISHREKSIDHNVLISGRSLHRYLAGTFTEDECHSLAAIFHRSAKPIPPLKLGKALHIFDQVTDIIAGPRRSWDKETAQVYGLQRRMIFFHHILRHSLFHPLIQRIPKLRLR
jgi:glycosyltransferase involved in cell wall biosynthesis